MNLLSINCGAYGSTGKIMFVITRLANESGIKAFSASPDNRRFPNKQLVPADIHHYTLMSAPIRKLNFEFARITGLDGFGAVFSTIKLCHFMEKEKIDTVHLHNIHMGFLNFRILFSYFKKHSIRVIWTLHDCWSFTGHCPHFLISECEKWKTECFSCPVYKDYPQSLFDNAKKLYHYKKSCFSGVDSLTLVVPSLWLKKLVKQSFLQEYPVKIIPNGIDLSIFRFSPSDFRQKYRLENKFILLAVAFSWSPKKGLDVLIDLAYKLPEHFQMVIVGTTPELEKSLPSQILFFRKTQNQQELAEMYSAADLFLNPTREDTFPTVNMEALACGTPVVTFNTGGSPEILDKTCGSVLIENTSEAMLKEILQIEKLRPFSRKNCIEHAKEFDKNQRFSDYIKIYKDLS